MFVSGPKGAAGDTGGAFLFGLHTGLNKFPFRPENRPKQGTKKVAARMDKLPKSKKENLLDSPSL